MYKVQKSMPVEQIARCLDMCAGVIMVVAGIYVEVTFGDLFSPAANGLLIGTMSTVALMQMRLRYVTVVQAQSSPVSL